MLWPRRLGAADRHTRHYTGACRPGSGRRALASGCGQKARARPCSGQNAHTHLRPPAGPPPSGLTHGTEGRKITLCSPMRQSASLLQILSHITIYIYISSHRVSNRLLVVAWRAGDVVLLSLFASAPRICCAINHFYCCSSPMLQEIERGEREASTEEIDKATLVAQWLLDPMREVA